MAGLPRVAIPLWLRITSFGFAAVLLSSLTIGGYGVWNQYREGEARIASEQDVRARAILADIESQRRIAVGLALQLAHAADLGAMIEHAAREEIVSAFGRDFASITEQAGPNVVVIANQDGTVVARLHDPTSAGESIFDRPMVVSAVRNAALTSGVEVGRAGLGIYAIAPVWSGGKVAGVVDVGTTLSNAYFARLKTALSVELAVRVLRNGKLELQNSTFAGGGGILSAAEIAQVIDGRFRRRIEQRGGQIYGLDGFVIRDFAGQVVGAVEVATNIDVVVANRWRAFWTTIAVSVALLGAALLMFFVSARRIGLTIQRLNQSMQRVAAGELTAVVPSVDRGDEIGAMARTIEIFKTGALERVRLEAEAKAVKAAADELARRTERERAYAAAEQSNVMAELGDRLSRLAVGDLTCRLDQPFAPAYERLREDFNGAAGQLQASFQDIVGSTNAIKTGVGEMTNAADDLSRRTEQQAATLEQTAAALEQITATVTSTAQSAAEAALIVEQARAGAERSGEVVRTAVVAMSEIEQSAREIGRNIGVIDEIAFQTSLLALNAGVEAARAGDSGRGFAVVASEVRALAQRSADAAKEIKALVAASGTQVARGVALVAETGDSLGTIVTEVSTAAEAIERIATAAQEQAAGLREVNTGVNQMDQVTQQTAAMVEQSTAASHALRSEAEALTALTERFRLAEAPATRTPGNPARNARQPTRRAAPKLAKVTAVAAIDAGWEEF
jgi:methyl-accepting chemotaxis protein